MAAVVRLAVLIALFALALAPGAHASTLLDESVSASSAAPTDCISKLHEQRQGVTLSKLGSAPASGYLTARLKAQDGDWDLAVFRATGGDAIAASAYRGADEVASGYVFEGEPLVVQACRRDGSDSTAHVSVELEELKTSASGAVKSSLVEVATPTRASKRKLTKLNLDLTEHGDEKSIAVVLHGAQDAKTLRDAGFTYQVEVADLTAQSKRDRAADARFASNVQTSALPSGRTTYRHLADYNNEMKQLVEENPNLARPIALPFKTWEGRTVEGIEISTNVNARDGKPVFLQMGAHHAREWPSAEHAMEWAYELLNGYRAGDPRTKELLEKTRTIVVPVINPDGFNASREFGELMGGGDGRGTPNSGEENESDNILMHPNEYRRKNCRAQIGETGSCAQPAYGLGAFGVDPNRNYGGFWGGAGASGDPQNETYWGPAPFSEPETRNVRHIVSTRQVTTLITNHTFSNLVLRPPGIQIQGETPDEPAYKALGKAMTDENGYANLFSYQLYDTTGTTEDWSYYATGGFGFTYEIGCVVPGDDPGECDTGHFHPPYAEMIKEYDGETPAADANGRDGKGNREAYYKALEHTAQPANHALLTGSAPAGAVLRLSKNFDTPTSRKKPDGTRETFADHLETTMLVPNSGRFEWHINQSTRPLVERDFGRQPTAPPSAPMTFSGDPSGPPGDGAVPGGDAESTDPLNYNEHPFTAPTDGDNGAITIRAEWNTPTSDWDMKVYRDVDGNDSVSDGDVIVGESEQGTTDFEQATFAPPLLEPGAKYVVRMTNFAAVEPYEGTISFEGPEFRAAKQESWTLTCEVPEGQPATTQQVVIDRGQAQELDLSGCGPRAGGNGNGNGGNGGPGVPGIPGVDKREKPLLSQSVRFSFDGRRYTARFRGRLRRFADLDGLGAASRAKRCAGTVTTQVKAGKRRVLLRRATVRNNCTFKRTMKFSPRRVPRAFRRPGASLRGYSRHAGNKFVLPAKKVTKRRVVRR